MPSWARSARVPPQHRYGYRPDKDRRRRPSHSARGDFGRDEPDFDEWGTANAAYRAVHRPARECEAPLFDRRGAAQAWRSRGVRLAKTTLPTSSRATTGRPKKTPLWTATTSTAGENFVTYERLRAMGTNGFQEPAVDFKDGKIVWHQAPLRGLAAAVPRTEPRRNEGAPTQHRRSRRGLQRQRLDPGDGAAAADGKAQANLHALRLSDR